MLVQVFGEQACVSLRKDSSGGSIMLLLFETAAGYALFKVLKEGKLQEAEVPSATVDYAVSGSRQRAPRPRHFVAFASHKPDVADAQAGLFTMLVLYCRTFTRTLPHQRMPGRWSSLRPSASLKTQLKLLQQQQLWWTASSAKVHMPQRSC